MALRADFTVLPAAPVATVVRRKRLAGQLDLGQQGANASADCDLPIPESMYYI